jgi:hypothetical protein
MEDGRIVERGTHETLYALEGRYWELYTRQHGIESNRLLLPGEKDREEEPETAGAPSAGRGDAGLPDPVTLLRGQGA